MAVAGDAVVGEILMSGPLYCHIEFAAALIREIGRQSDVQPHEVLADIARIL